MTAADDAKEKKKKKDEGSPLLQRILHGGSSVSLNLIGKAAHVRHPMFKTASMNNIIVFKYPNFAESTEAKESIYDPKSMTYIMVPVRKTEEELDQEAAANPRPVETGIFVPYDLSQIHLGGHGIYLRKHNYQQLMSGLLGVDLEATDPDAIRDAKILGMIDQIPSLDPFLLKEALLKIDPKIDERYFEISDEETQGIKSMITAKLMPILDRALRDVDEYDRVGRQRRFLDAIWDPSMPEAQMFISAFGIDKSESGRVFEALKGISFYEWNVVQGSKKVAEAVKWLQSDQTLPHDIRQHQHRLHELNMFRTQVVNQVRDVSRKIGEIFKAYNNAHTSFREKDDPKPIRQFLRSVNRHYWSLGYGSAALGNVGHLHANAMRSATKGKLSFDETVTLLQHFGMALKSTVSVPSSGV